MRIRTVLASKDRPIITIGPERTVAEAVAELVGHNIGSLPVVDESGGVVGIFTERDVLRGLHNRGKDFCGVAVGEVMTRDVACCGPDDTVHDAMGRMSDRSIGQLPVIEDDRVVGLVSVGDLIRILHDSATEENRNLMSYVYGAV